jgi:probable HAF family extracellular repeat protein
MPRTAITKLALMTLTALAVFVEGVAHPAQAGIVYILKDLGTLPNDTDSRGNAVNASGQVVGDSNTAGDTASHAFLYSDGQMLDLNDLIAPDSGFTLAVAQGISDNGYITGGGVTSDGLSHAFLLVPVPEPAAWLLLGTGAIALLGYALHRRRAAVWGVGRDAT